MFNSCLIVILDLRLNCPRMYLFVVYLSFGLVCYPETIISINTFQVLNTPSIKFSPDIVITRCQRFIRKKGRIS